MFKNLFNDINENFIEYFGVGFVFIMVSIMLFIYPTFIVSMFLFIVGSLLVGKYTLVFLTMLYDKFQQKKGK